MPYEIENRKWDFTAIPIHNLLPMPHIHPHLELIYLEKGSGAAVLDHREYVLEAGDLFLSFPNQIHFYHVKDPVEGYMTIFAPTLFGDLKEVFQTKIPVCPVLHKDQIPSDTGKRLEKMCEKLKTDLSYDKIGAKGWLLTLLGEILPLMAFEENPGDQDTIKNILKFCMENYTEPLSLQSLSKALNLNPYYISHIFSERMHISYNDFINNLRVEHACELLEKGSSITYIAYASGFSSVRTFNRAFLKYRNLSPRDYRKQLLSSQACMKTGKLGTSIE